MAAAALITGLTVFFSVTTLAVFAYPLVRLTPSWLERRLHRKAAAHGDALAALEMALAAPVSDGTKLARLQAQRDFHAAALRSLAVINAVPTVTGPLPVEIAA